MKLFIRRRLPCTTPRGAVSANVRSHRLAAYKPVPRGVVNNYYLTRASNRIIYVLARSIYPNLHLAKQPLQGLPVHPAPPARLSRTTCQRDHPFHTAATETRLLTKLQSFKIMMTRVGFSQDSRLKFNIRRDHLLEDA